MLKYERPDVVNLQGKILAEIRKRMKPKKCVDAKAMPDVKSKSVVEREDDGHFYTSDGKRWSKLIICPGVGVES